MSYDDVLNACESTISVKNSLGTKLQREKTTLTQQAEEYSLKGKNALLFQIAQSQNVGALTKDDLINLYDYHFVGKKAGNYYDLQILSAREKCPFCGGIGRPANLDHFMPKSDYPQFSVFPINLIPSCRDCNMGNKKGRFATAAANQILHPFLDDQKFFDIPWISAQYHPASHGNPSYVEYSVSPPNAWSQQDQDRVRRHFSEFDLKKRYSVEAATELVLVEAQIKAQQQSATPSNEIKSVLLQPVIDSIPFVNHWKRVMYIAIMESIP